MNIAAIINIGTHTCLLKCTKVAYSELVMFILFFMQFNIVFNRPKESNKMEKKKLEQSIMLEAFLKKTKYQFVPNEKKWKAYNVNKI